MNILEKKSTFFCGDSDQITCLCSLKFLLSLTPSARTLRTKQLRLCRKQVVNVFINSNVTYDWTHVLNVIIFPIKMELEL